ncbi:hypothetical protein B0H11DRAFT_2031355 [Mycena galericulata]|nr:hypothetical protein B0H11DRAFT_2031355 [Mycena galericulata]
MGDAKNVRAKKVRVSNTNASDAGPAARVQPSNGAQKKTAVPLSKPVESPTSPAGMGAAKKVKVSDMNASDAGPAARVQPSDDAQKQPAAPLSKPVKSPTSASRGKRTAPNSLASDTARKRQRVQSPLNERLSVADAEESKQVEKVAKETMRPVKKHLKYLGEQVSATRSEEVDKAVVTIGRHLEKVVEQKEASGEDAAQWSRRLWAFTALFWPEAAEATNPEELYRELVAQRPTAPISEMTEVPEDVAETRALQQLSPEPSNPPLLTPVTLSNPASTTITDEADPVLAELLAVMKRNTVIFKSEAASSARSIASTSTRHRNTVQPARPAAMSTTSTKAAAADPGRQARPSQGRSRSGSATLMRRTDRSPSLPIDAPPPSPHKAAYSPLQASDARSRRSLAEPTAPNDGFAVAAEEGPSLSTIVELRNRYIGCQSEAVSQKQTNAGWTAEAAATALIEALTAAYDALKRENEGLKAENRRLSGDVLIEPERMEPEEEEVVREEDRSAETPVGDMMQEIEESVVQNTPPVVASDTVKVKEEKLSVCIPPEIVAPPKTRLSGRGMPPSMGAEVIDLTLDDSDDEDAHVPIPPPATSSASMPVAPAAVVDNSDPLVDEIMQDEPVPNDSVPMDEETDPLGDSMDLEPPLDVESRSNTMDIDEDLDAPTSAEAPPDTTGLVVPSISAPGHFRIDDTDYDYPDARLTELVLLNGAQNDPTTHDWGTILAHLQLTDKRSSNKPFSVEVWRATVDALREYYMQFLAPYVDTAPTLQQREESDTLILGASVSNPGTPPAAHDRDSVVDEGHESAPRGRTPGSETRATLKIAIDHSRSPPITTPTTIGSDDPRLLDPSECRTALPLPNVKIEQDAVQGLGLEIGDGVRCQPGGRRLKQMHLDIVFPRCGGQFLECVMCLGDGCMGLSSLNRPPTEFYLDLREKYEWPYQSPLDVLSAHLILIQTAGMNAIQMQEWFAQLEE